MGPETALHGGLEWHVEDVSRHYLSMLRALIALFVLFFAKFQVFGRFLEDFLGLATSVSTVDARFFSVLGSACGGKCTHIKTTLRQGI